MGKIKIGARLKALREAKGVSQTQVVKDIGILKKSLSSYENDRNFPPPDILLKLAKYYKVSTDFLLLGLSIVADHNKEIEKYKFFKYLKEVDKLEGKYQEAVEIMLKGVILESKEDV